MSSAEAALSQPPPSHPSTMPLPHAKSQRLKHVSQPNSANVSTQAKKSASAATSPRSAAASSCVSPGSTKSPPSADYVKARLKTLMSPKNKMPPIQSQQQHSARSALSPIASPKAQPKKRLPHIEQPTEVPPRSLSNSPSVSVSMSLHSHSSSDHSHSPLLAPLPSSLTASPMRPPAHLPSASYSNLPIMGTPSATHLPPPPGQLLPDHLSPRWAEMRKDVEEEHKEVEQDDRTHPPAAIPHVTQNTLTAVPTAEPPPASDSPALSSEPAVPEPVQSVPSLSLPVIPAPTTALLAEPSSSTSISSARTLHHSVSLPPVLEGERDTSTGGVSNDTDKKEHDQAQEVLRSASLPLSPHTTAPSPPLPPPALPSIVIDSSTDWDAAHGRLKGSSVTRIERLVSARDTGRSADEVTAREVIPEGDEAVESVAVTTHTQLTIDALSPSESSAVEEAVPLTSTRGGRHNSIEGAGDYPLSPSSAAEAFDTIAAQNAQVALSQPPFSPMPHPLHMQQMAHLAQPYAAPLMSGFAPALSAHPYAMLPGYAHLTPPLPIPGLSMPMPGLPYGAHPMDAQYQHYLLMQQQQQHQQALMAAAAAQAEPPRSYSSASFHSYSPAPFTHPSGHAISYSPQPQMRYAPTPSHYPQPPPTFSQSRLSVATGHSPSPNQSTYGSQPPPLSRTTTSANLTDTQARLAFFRDIANNRHADVKEQLERGMTPHCTDRNGNTPLHIACQHGLRRIVKSLLRVGADINAGNREGNTPLHMCYGYHYEELGDYLKSKGANDRKLNAFGMSCYDGLKPSDGNAFASLDTPSNA